MVRSDTPHGIATLLRSLLEDPEKRALHTGADLFAIAFALADSPILLEVDAAVDLLLAAGLPADAPRADLAERIRADTHRDPTFIAYNDHTFCIDRRKPRIQARLGPLVARALDIDIRRDAEIDPRRWVARAALGAATPAPRAKLRAAPAKKPPAKKPPAKKAAPPK